LTEGRASAKHCDDHGGVASIHAAILAPGLLFFGSITTCNWPGNFAGNQQSHIVKTRIEVSLPRNMCGTEAQIQDAAKAAFSLALQENSAAAVFAGTRWVARTRATATRACVGESLKCRQIQSPATAGFFISGVHVFAVSAARGRDHG